MWGGWQQSQGGQGALGRKLTHAQQAFRQVDCERDEREGEGNDGPFSTARTGTRRGVEEAGEVVGSSPKKERAKRA